MREGRNPILIQSSREAAITPDTRGIKDVRSDAKIIKPTH